MFPGDECMDTPDRAGEQSGKWSGASRKSGGAERSGERSWQIMMERKCSAEQEVME